jgi:hypothetical protein
MIGDSGLEFFDIADELHSLSIKRGLFFYDACAFLTLKLHRALSMSPRTNFLLS